MYIFELIAGIFRKKDKHSAEISEQPPVDFAYLPGESPEGSGDNTDCEHVFMPVDSSRETLACRNCGLVVKK